MLSIFVWLMEARMHANMSHPVLDVRLALAST